MGPTLMIAVCSYHAADAAYELTLDIEISAQHGLTARREGHSHSELVCVRA